MNAIDTKLRDLRKLGTDAMVVDGIKMDAVAGSGGNPLSKYQV